MESSSEYGLGKCLHDYPHEDLMDDKGIHYDDLNPTIQREIETFNSLYYDALIDGIITKEEEKTMRQQSEKIAQAIQNEFKKQSNDGGIILTIFGSIILGIGAYYGIKKISNT